MAKVRPSKLFLVFVEQPEAPLGVRVFGGL
jgi:hypothetical protein